MTRYLSLDDIYEATGARRDELHMQLHSLHQLEILFTSFDEINSLQFCPNLTQLSLIDNGLKTISNLSPISETLVILRLCDQELTSVDILDHPLPKLEELYLHRNNILSFSNNPISLRNIASIKILWLSQNKLSFLPSNLLLYLSQLQELRIESNDVKDLDFLLSVTPKVDNIADLSSSITLTKSKKTIPIRNHHPLSKLGLSGNPISDVKELLKLSAFDHMTDIYLQDIHYGKCPLTYDGKPLPLPLPLALAQQVDQIDEDQWYRDYIIVHLPQIRTIDGIKVTVERIDYVNKTLKDEKRRHESALRLIEDEYEREVIGISLEGEAKQNHLMLLEREITGAFGELQDLVEKGKNIMIEKFQSHRDIIENLTNTHQINLATIKTETESNLQDSVIHSIESYDRLSSAYTILSNILSVDRDILSLFDTNQRKDSQSRLEFDNKLSETKQYDNFERSMIGNRIEILSSLICSSIHESSTTYQTMARLLQPSMATSIIHTYGNTCNIELIRMYQIQSTSMASKSTSTASKSKHSLFYLLTIHQLKQVLLFGWSSLKDSIILCSNPMILHSIYSSKDKYSIDTSSKRSHDILSKDRFDHNLRNYDEDLNVGSKMEDEEDDNEDNHNNKNGIEKNSIDMIYGKNLDAVVKMTNMKTTSNTSKTSTLDTKPPTESFDPMQFPILKAAKQKGLYLIATCEVNEEILSSCGDMIRSLSTPVTIEELDQISSKVAINLSSSSVLHSGSNPDMLYVIPSVNFLNDYTDDMITIKFLSLCIRPTIPGGLQVIQHTIEKNYVESTYLDTDSRNKTTNTSANLEIGVLKAVSAYEDNVYDEIKNYITTLADSLQGKKSTQKNQAIQSTRTSKTSNYQQPSRKDGNTIIVRDSIQSQPKQSSRFNDTGSTTSKSSYKSSFSSSSSSSRLSTSPPSISGKGRSQVVQKAKSQRAFH